MKLGEKLKQTLDALEQAKIKSLEERAAADLEKIRQQRLETEQWLNSIKELFVSQINADKVPLYKVKDYDQQRWIREAVHHKSANSDLWNNFSQFWIKEGLEPVLEEAHDGMGMDSWINLTVKILPARPRNFATGGAYEG